MWVQSIVLCEGGVTTGAVADVARRGMLRQMLMVCERRGTTPGGFGRRRLECEPSVDEAA